MARWLFIAARLIFFAALSNTATALPSQTEELALLRSIYTKLNLASCFPYNLHWFKDFNESSSPGEFRAKNASVHCNWPGVVCTSPWVVQISIDGSYGNCNLTGPLPEELGKFTFVRNIILRDINTQNLPFPDFLCNISMLSMLEVSNCAVGGPLPDCLTSSEVLLQDLVLSGNNFVGDNFSKWASSFRYLRTLYLSGRPYNEDCKSPYSDFSKFPFNAPLAEDGKPSALCFIRHEDAKRGMLTGRLDKGLNVSRSLTYLSISHNSFTGSLPNVDKTRLLYFNVEYNNLTGTNPGNLEVLKSLRGEVPRTLASGPFIGYYTEGNSAASAAHPHSYLCIVVIAHALLAMILSLS